MSKKYKIDNVSRFPFQRFSSTDTVVDSATSICCDREIPKADSVFDPRKNDLFNQKWLQKKNWTFWRTVFIEDHQKPDRSLRQDLVIISHPTQCHVCDN